MIPDTWMERHQPTERMDGSKYPESLKEPKNRTQEVWGSIPHSSTGKLRGHAEMRGLFAFSASSPNTLRPRHAVRERRLPADAHREPHHVQHEPSGQLLGQRRRRELLLDPQGRARRPLHLAAACARAGGYPRVHQRLLQPPTTPFLPRLLDAGRARAELRAGAAAGSV